MNALPPSSTPTVDPRTGQEIPAKIPEEIKFDKAAYGGISFFAQAAAGTVVSKSIRYGMLKEPFSNFVKWITHKPPTEAASTTAIITVMIMMGNAFLLPLKWVENRKHKIVRWMCDRNNAKNPPTPEEKAAQDARIDYIEHAPKQSWPSLLGGRGFALGVVYAVDYLLGKKRNAAMQDTFAELTQRGLGKIGLKALEKSKNLGEYLRIGSIDAFYSSISAGGLYTYSHLIHPGVTYVYNHLLNPKKRTPASNPLTPEENLSPMALPLVSNFVTDRPAHPDREKFKKSAIAPSDFKIAKTSQSFSQKVTDHPDHTIQPAI